MNTKLPTIRLCLLAVLATAGSVRAQWLSQSFALKSGWNAIYLHVDPSYASLADLVAASANSPILEVWSWVPAIGQAQFVQSPSQPTADDTQWTSWSQSDSANSQLQRLVGNSAYLVRAASNCTWTIKGRPLAPAYEWTTTGLNFMGFPTVTNGPPTFDTFLSRNTALQSAEIYYYPGGDLGSGNPARLYSTRSYKVTRGQAFWLRAGTTYNSYFAPFDISLGGSGVDFGARNSTATLWLRNQTASALTVTLRLVASETPPAGQAAIGGAPPLLVRGGLNLTDFTYTCTNLALNATRSWSLAASGQTGSEVQVVLGLNRSAITNAPGALLAGVLRFTDSLGQAQVDAPVTATAGSEAGLWVGNAIVTQVGQYLVTYSSGAAAPIIVTNGTTVVTNSLSIATNGAYVVANVNTNLGSVPSAYPLRLIVHNPATGPSVLLQQVYCGLDAAGTSIVATAESLLDPAQLATARRISAVHLPWTAANAGWTFSGNLAGGGLLTATVSDSYKDRASNPFLHGYHPDHDNLDSTFSNELPQGSESYTIQRAITLQPTPPSNDFASLTTGNQSLSGAYLETTRILGLSRGGGTTDTRTFRATGSFTLRRISEAAILTTP